MGVSFHPWEVSSGCLFTHGSGEVVWGMHKGNMKEQAHNLLHSSYLGTSPLPVSWVRHALPATQREERVRESTKSEPH
jgi:hypothetical protein